ncbi:hypothetical protein GCM10010140_44100 [Streptosporangium pseudovulgare]|uniref:Uncharacterized protein n=1 Tax=Streptosporangium pseudovulgare TaxID=35765 RepID=A0ABQ2R4Z0_9ACTN|nr:hypothetical protein GCM10010140_44100 [Streptosporangium pseudovulgare]
MGRPAAEGKRAPPDPRADGRNPRARPVPAAVPAGAGPEADDPAAGSGAAPGEERRPRRAAARGADIPAAEAAAEGTARCLSRCLPVNHLSLVTRRSGSFWNLGRKHTDLSSVTDVAAINYIPESSEVISAMCRTERVPVS